MSFPLLSMLQWVKTAFRVKASQLRDRKLLLTPSSHLLTLLSFPCRNTLDNFPCKCEAQSLMDDFTLAYMSI